MVKPESLLNKVLAKALNAILSSQTLLWIEDFSISEFASNVPTTRNMSVNFRHVGLIGIIRRLHLHWRKKHVKVVIHRAWNLKLVLAIEKLYSLSLTRHFHPNGFIILTINLMLISASF